MKQLHVVSFSQSSLESHSFVSYAGLGGVGCSRDYSETFGDHLFSFGPWGDSPGTRHDRFDQFYGMQSIFEKSSNYDYSRFIWKKQKLSHDGHHTKVTIYDRKVFILVS